MIKQIEPIYYDSIVDGYNTSYIQKQYEDIIHSTKPYALVYMNIKNFRYYNTKYGHKQGNEILRLIYHHTAKFLGERGVIAHMFADNFACLVCHEDMQSFIYKDWAQLVDLLYRINNPCIYREIFLSYGFYLLDIQNKLSFHDALNLANVSRKCSDNLYQRTCNIELYDIDFINHYMGHHELEIKTADAYKNYEFLVYLQPKVDIKTNKIVGAEALLRWKDKDGRFVPVFEFLPILNENGYIELIDLDTFDVVCNMLDKRLKAGLPIVPISFNISKSTFYDPEIFNDYGEIYHKYDIPTEYIEFELMESISLDDTSRMTEVIAGFRKFGFKCSLDDFGSGYSSFTVLLNADLNTVKMDRQFFLENLNGDSKLIIKTVVELIKSLHMDVIAEGVELKEHVDFLKECGCDIIQGYYFYKPMPIEEFNQTVEEQYYSGKP